MSLGFSALQRVAAPTVELVTTAEAKAQLRVLHSDDDLYIASLISAAREWAETFTRRAFAEQTWMALYAGWAPDRLFSLARHPVLSVETFQFVNPAGTLTTLASSNYTTELAEGVVMLKLDTACPALSSNHSNPVRITFKAGFTPATIPANWKAALLLAITNLYENRVPVVQGTITSKVPLSVESLLKPLKLYTT